MTTNCPICSAYRRSLRPCRRSRVIYKTSLPNISTMVQKHNQRKQSTLHTHLSMQRLSSLSRRATMAHLSRLRWTGSRLSTLPSFCLAARWCSCSRTVPRSPRCFCCWPSRCRFQTSPTGLCWPPVRESFILIPWIKSFISQRHSLATWDISSQRSCNPLPT